jgi:hypothetical protein
MCVILYYLEDLDIYDIYAKGITVFKKSAFTKHER